MKADKTFSGVTPDHGTILRVNTRQTSESTAALNEELAIYDSYSLGGHLRPVRRAVFMDRPLFGLSLLANNAPLVEIAWQQALQAFKPYEELLNLDDVISSFDSGTMRCPTVTVQLANTVIANSYKFSQTLVQAQNAWYDDRANWLTGQHTEKHCDEVTTINMANGRHVPALDPVDLYRRGDHGSCVGYPTMPRVNPYQLGQLQGGPGYTPNSVILLPVVGQGPAPFYAIQYHMGEHVAQWDDLIPLKWGIFYQEQDTEIASPLKKVVMIAYLVRLFNYLNGSNRQLGQYQWPRVDGTPSTPYTSSGNRTDELTGHDIINRVLMEVARAAALKLEYRNAEDLPGCDELNLIRAIANVLYFLDNTDLVISALLNTADVRQFLTLLLESWFMQNGVQAHAFTATADDMHAPANLDQPGFRWQLESAVDVTAGFVPPQANDFLWHSVMESIPADDFVLMVMREITGRHIASDNSAYANLLKRSMVQGAEADPDVLMNEMRLMISAEISSMKRMSADVRADYIASAMLARLRESLPVISALFKGQIPGFEHIHATAVPILSLEVMVNIMDTIGVMVDRDLISTQDILQWEEPFTGARYSTQWSTYSLRFPLYPIPYVIHDIAEDVLGEIRLLGNKYGAANVATMVEQAFQTVGTKIVQCEPACTYLPLSSARPNDQAPRRLRPFFLAGERELCGQGQEDEQRLFGNISVSHAALRVTSTYFVRSHTIWNQIMEMPHTMTARTYLPQPVPPTWHAAAFMRVPVSMVRRLVDGMPSKGSATNRVIGSLLDTIPAGAWFVHTIDLNPAFRDVGVVIPYVQMLVQTPPEAFGFSMMSRVNFDDNQRICNLAGEALVLDRLPDAPVAGVGANNAWQLPNLENEMAYSATPVTHMVLPLLWNALR